MLLLGGLHEIKYFLWWWFLKGVNDNLKCFWSNENRTWQICRASWPIIGSQSLMKICGGTEGIICELFGTGWTIYGQGGLFDLAVERGDWYEKHPNLCRVQMNSLLQNLSEEVITDWPETKDPLVTTFKSTVKHCQYCHKDTIARVNLVSHVLKRVENCDRVRCKLHSPVLLVPHVRAENSF